MRRVEWTDAGRVLSILVTAFFFATAVLQALLVFDILAAALGVIDAYPFNQLSVLVVAAVLLPIWALWLAIRVPLLRQPET